jgi:DNA polymerase III delta prime subunit
MKVYNFNDIVGHTNTKTWLKAKLDADKVPKVLLFCGLPGIGKTSMAKVLACELAYKDAPEKLNKGKETVIDNDTSTDCVKLYNMSTLKKDEEVSNLINDLTVGLSSTGRKVILMDEAHNMSELAQDSLLTRFENLDDGVYIIICTTDITCLRDALKSRAIIRNFLPPSNAEVRGLVKNAIDQKGLKFSDITETLAISYILASCNNEPRRIINIIDALDNTKPVTREDLTQFGMYDEPKKYLVLVRYLYSHDIVNGLQFIEDLPAGFTDVSINILLDMVKALYDGESKLLSQDIKVWLQNNASENKELLMTFVSKLATRGRLTKSYISGVFIELCMDVHNSAEKVISRAENATMLEKHMQKDIEFEDVATAVSLEDLMMRGETVE